MPKKIVPLVSGGIYHIYNRGVDKRVVFKNKADFERFKVCLQLFNTIEPIGSLFELRHSRGHSYDDQKPLVRIHSYCLLPNHFHLILTQVEEGGVSEFMKRLGGGYTSYFNENYQRSGSLFQGTYKRVLIETDSQLEYVTAYVNLNYIVHGIDQTKAMSSIGSYTGMSSEKFVNPDFVLRQNQSKYYVNAKELVEGIRKKREISKIDSYKPTPEFLE